MARPRFENALNSETNAMKQFNPTLLLSLLCIFAETAKSADVKATNINGHRNYTTAGNAAAR